MKQARSPLPGLVLIAAGLALLGLAGWQFSRGENAESVNSVNALPTISTPVPVVPPPTVVAPGTAPADAEAWVRAATLLAPPTAPPPTPNSPATAPTLAPIATLQPAPPGAARGTLPKPTRIVIPAIGVDAPVVDMGWKVVQQDGQSVSEWVVPANAVGHAINSANPGERDNVVVSGHNNLYAAVFKKLYTLKPGDEIAVWNAAGQSFLYRVVQSYIMPETGISLEQRIANGSVMLPTNDARLTLTSCWPEWSNTHRAIVIAMLASQ